MTSLEKKARKSTATRRSKDSSWGSAAYGARNGVKRLHAPGYSPILILRANTAWMAWCRTCRSSKKPGAAKPDNPWWLRTPATFVELNRPKWYRQSRLKVWGQPPSAVPPTVFVVDSVLKGSRLQGLYPWESGALAPLKVDQRGLEALFGRLSV